MQSHTKHDINYELLQICSIHEGKQAELYCINDGIQVCPICSLTSHNIHELLTLKEASLKFKTVFKGFNYHEYIFALQTNIQFTKDKLNDSQKIYNKENDILLKKLRDLQEEVNKLKEKFSNEKKELTERELVLTNELSEFKKMESSFQTEKNDQKVVQWKILIDKMTKQIEKKVFVFGYNAHGQLGLGNLKDQLTPQPFSLLNVKAISCGEKHSIALLEDGTIWSFGYNGHGELGLGHSDNVSIPTEIKLGQVDQLSSGQYHSLALTGKH